MHVFWNQLVVNSSTVSLNCFFVAADDFCGTGYTFLRPSKFAILFC